jgi:6-phosphogluconolactonase
MAGRGIGNVAENPRSDRRRARDHLRRGPPDEAAAAYRLELQDHLGVDGRFDLILLGMGPDGQTASLFPDTAAVQEQERSVVPVYVEKLDAWRVTLTLPVIDAVRRVVFLVSGEEKAHALARVYAGELRPAAMVQPVVGKLSWLVDRQAAAQLPPET